MLNRRIDLYSYDIYPKVVPVGREVTVTVQAIDPHLMQDFPYTVSLYAINDAGKVLESNLPCTPLAAPMQGFTVTVTLPKEQEYLCRSRMPTRRGLRPTCNFTHWRTISSAASPSLVSFTLTPSSPTASRAPRSLPPNTASRALTSFPLPTIAVGCPRPWP